MKNFPAEDTKMGAEHVQRRRGGNIGNTLEVLSDILDHYPAALTAPWMYVSSGYEVGVMS
jgi:hypothetical protein